MKAKRLLLYFLPPLAILFSLPQAIFAATLANTFQITTDGSQQTSPFVYKNMVMYTSHSDIWGYDLETNTNFPILEKEGQQFTTGFYKNLIVYENTSPEDIATDLYVYNLETGKDLLVAGGPGSQTSGVTNSKVVVYVDGGACGSLKVYDLKNKTTKQIFDFTCHPIRISGDIVVFPVADPNGTNIGGYNLAKGEVFDIATGNYFQESPNIFADKVVWLHRLSGAHGDYNAIVIKDLSSGEERIVYESSTNALGGPAISRHYVVWSESSAPHVGGVKAADLRTGEIFEVQTQGPHQNSHTSPAIWKNFAVWQAWRTGNGDIYGSIFER